MNYGLKFIVVLVMQVMQVMLRLQGQKSLAGHQPQKRTREISKV